MDVRQTMIYYEHSFNMNGSYATWAYEYNKTTNGTMETVNPGYYYTAIVVWVLPPFLMSAFVFIMHFRFTYEFTNNNLKNSVIRTAFNKNFGFTKCVLQGVRLQLSFL